MGLTTNSGESSFVNASLKLNAAHIRATTDGTETQVGAIWFRRRINRPCSQIYDIMTISQRSLGYVVMKDLTMSGSPANFWPVWFQPRTSLVAAIAVKNRAQFSRVVCLKKTAMLTAAILYDTGVEENEKELWHTRSLTCSNI